MPVHINYKGRLGNKIFQYVSGRVFAEKNELNLITELINDVVEFTTNKKYDGDNNTNSSITISAKDFNENEIISKGKNVSYTFSDFFQNGDYINNNEKLIKKFFKIPPYKKNYNDIVMHLRLDDFIHVDNISNPIDWSRSEIVSPNYYKNILKNEDFKTLYIVVDKINYEWEKRYLKYFDEFNPVVMTQTAKEDFEFIMKFNKIITSNSTFCYWSAFLSDAEKIYTFGNIGKYGKDLTSHGNHVQNIDNIKNKSISIKEDFYYGVD